jgi:hypothetical protein
MSKRGSIGYLICAVLFGCGGIILLAWGLLSLPESKEEKMYVTTSQTTAVVIDKHVERSGGEGPGPGREPVYMYWVFLDFTYSDLGQERIALLNQRPQGVQIRFKSDYDNFRIGQAVTMVYRTPESAEEKLCVESVAGCELWGTRGDLRLPRGASFGWLACLILAVVCLAGAGVSLFGYYRGTTSRGPKYL